MNFHIFHPGDALRPFVKQYYFWEDDSRGTIQLPQNLFALGDQYMIFIREGEASVKPADHAPFTLPRNTITGQFTCACRLQVKGPVKMVIVQLNAYGSYRLLGLNMQTFTNYCRNLEVHGEAVWTQLAAQLGQAAHPAEITDMLDNTFEQVLASNKHTLQQVDEIADHLLARQGNVSMEELAAAFHISRPTLERRFNTIVGIPPQLFARMVRYKTALHAHRQMNLPQWQISTTAYYNQSMFIKDYLVYNGELPSWFASPVAATIAHMPVAELQQVAVAS